MRLIQLMGENVEELWNFPDETTDEQIKSWYKEYEDDTCEHNEENFESFMENRYPELDCERLFVDEIYV